MSLWKYFGQYLLGYDLVITTELACCVKCAQLSLPDEDHTDYKHKTRAKRNGHTVAAVSGENQNWIDSAEKQERDQSRAKMNEWHRECNGLKIR